MKDLFKEQFEFLCLVQVLPEIMEVRALDPYWIQTPVGDGDALALRLRSSRIHFYSP